MAYRTGLKRLFTVCTLCWLGVCLIGGITVSRAPGRMTMTPVVFGQAPATGEWTGYTKDLLKGLTGSEYEAIRNSYFFRNVAATVSQARHSISLSKLSFGNVMAAGERPDKPDRSSVNAQWMNTSKVNVPAWLAIVTIPPILLYVIGFVVIPRLTGGFESSE
jgi:hypothetical protein